jgi:hypothetical protein
MLRKVHLSEEEKDTMRLILSSDPCKKQEREG